MLVSVLLPARDASATVQQALDGIFAQRGAPPFEVICVDDGSIDGTRAILERYDVRIVQGERSGLVAALNKGLAHCTGDLVARMDADDLVHPDRLALQCRMLEDDASLGAVGSLVEIDAPGLKRLEDWLNQTVSKEQCRLARFIEAPLVHPSTMFRRIALDQYEDHGWAEDWDLLLRLVEDGWELGKVPHKLLVWRDSPQRLTRTHPTYRGEAMFRLRAHYLSRGPLRDREFDIWGAGPTGKRLARALEEHGRRPRAFYDVAPDKRMPAAGRCFARTGCGPPART